MELSTDLISQFAKITNDQKTSRIDEVTLYGEVVEFENRICVKLDGSNELTPVTTISDIGEGGEPTNFRYGSASVKAGDRVSVRLKNHSATITGNLTDPSMGKAQFSVEEDRIIAVVNNTINGVKTELEVKDGEIIASVGAANSRIDAVSLRIDQQGVNINGLTTFTNTLSNNLSGLSDGLSNGTTIIDGGCIKTGKIDAQHITLTGLIKYEYSVDGVNNWHYPMASGDMYRRESIDAGETWGDPYQFVGKDGQNGHNGSDANVPRYIELRGIDFTNISNNYIKSPKIYGGEFYGNEFNVIAEHGSGSFNLYGEDSFGLQHHCLQISFFDGMTPSVTFTSPDDGDISIGTPNSGGKVIFIGDVVFNYANVSGITAEFA